MKRGILLLVGLVLSTKAAVLPPSALVQYANTVVGGGSPSGTAGTNTLSWNTLTAWANTANVTFYQSPSFTPSTNTLLVFAQAFSPTGTDTVTNTGSTQLTWWKVASTNYDTAGTPAHTLSVWVTQLPRGTAPFAMTVVALHGSGTGIDGIVGEVTGTDQTAAFGTNAIVQAIAFAATSANPTNQFAAPGNNGSNMLVYVVGDDINSAADNAATLSWVEQWETNYNTPAAGLALYTSNMVPAVVTLATNTATSRDWSTIMLSVKAGTNMVDATANVIHEGFEGTGLPSGWTEAGSVDWDYTTTILDGSQSMSVNNAFSDVARAYFNEFSDVWVYFRFRISDISGSPPAIYLLDSRATEMGRVNFVSDGSINSTCGSATTGGGTGFAANTTYSVWVHYRAGTGANGLLETYVSTTTTRPAVTANCTTGSSCGAVSIISFEPFPDATVYVIDNVIVRYGNIGDNPF